MWRWARSCNDGGDLGPPVGGVGAKMPRRTWPGSHNSALGPFREAARAPSSSARDTARTCPCPHPQPILPLKKLSDSATGCSLLSEFLSTTATLWGASSSCLILWLIDSLREIVAMADGTSNIGKMNLLDPKSRLLNKVDKKNDFWFNWIFV